MTLCTEEASLTGTEEPVSDSDRNRHRRTSPGPKMRGYPVRNHKTKAIEPSRNSIKRRKPVDVSRIRTERERIQRTEKRRKRADVPQVKMERERIQRTQNAWKGLVHPEQGPREKNFRYLKAGILPSMASTTRSFERKANQRGIQSRQGEDTRHQGGNLQRQRQRLRGRSGT